MGMDAPREHKGARMDKLDVKLSSVAGRLRCPECGAGPLTVGDGVACPGCGAGYEIRNGIPILLSRQSRMCSARELESSTGSAMVGEYRHVEETADGGIDDGARGKSWVDLLRPPDVLYHPNPWMQKPPANRLFHVDGRAASVLNVGGGPKRYSPHEICMNLDTFFNVNAVGDAHNIPFMDDTFDSVFANAVLEHVYDPRKVADEMRRVLKPGGLFYAEIPFLFFFHGYPNDFQRLTREGVRRLVDGLADVEIGITCGAASAMVQSLNVFCNLLLPSRPALVRKAFNGVYRWLLFPVKYLDIPLNRRPDSHVLAGGFYVFGRKPRQGE